MSTRPHSPPLLTNARTSNRLSWLHAVAALLLASATAVSAQTAPIEQKILTEFPADAVTLAPVELQQRLEGKVHTVRLANGASWRLDYRGEYVFVNLSTGPSDKGRWRVDGSQVCTEYVRFPSSCTEMRASANRLYFKRASTGEVLAMDVVQ